MTSAGRTDRTGGPAHPPVEAGEPLGLLLAAAGRVMSERMKPAFDRAHLHPRQMHLMKLVADQTATTQQKLIEALHVDPSVLVGLLNDLEDRGLVRRIRDPKDRRRHIVEVSASGARRLKGVLAHAEEAERVMFDHLSRTDQLALRRLLTSILERQAVLRGVDDEC